MDESTKKSKNYLQYIIPAVLAVLVIITLAISGRISANRDSEKAENLSKRQTTSSASQQSGKVDFVACGNNFVDDEISNIFNTSDSDYDFTPLYANVKDYISGADISAVSQETILGGATVADSLDGGKYTGSPNYNVPWSVGDAMRNAGFDIFACATEHSLDKGFEGIQSECKYFDGHTDVLHVGTNDSEDEYNEVHYYEKNGITFAFLNYTFSTNDNTAPSDKTWCVNMMDDDKIKTDVASAKKNADVVIAMPHWGTYNSGDVTEYQKKYASLFASLGVDVVIGTHPHELQKVEWVTDKSTGNKTLVYYSLGSFVSDDRTLNNLCGGMADIKFEKKDGKTTITSAYLTPVISWYGSGENGDTFSVYTLDDYNDDLAESFNVKGGTKDYYTKYVKGIIPEEFLNLD